MICSGPLHAGHMATAACFCSVWSGSLSSKGEGCGFRREVRGGGLQKINQRWCLWAKGEWTPGLRIFKGGVRGPPSGSARPQGAGVPVKKAPCSFCFVAGPCPRMKEVKSCGGLGHGERRSPLPPSPPSACCLCAPPGLSFRLSLPHLFSPFHFVSFLSLVPLPPPILKPFTLFLFSLCLLPHLPLTFPGLQLPGTQSKLSGSLQVLTFNCDSWKPLGLSMETHRTRSQACTGRLCLQPGLPPLSQAHTFPAAFWFGHFAAEIGDS